MLAKQLQKLSELNQKYMDLWVKTKNKHSIVSKIACLMQISELVASFGFIRVCKLRYAQQQEFCEFNKHSLFGFLNGNGREGPIMGVTVLKMKDVCMCNTHRNIHRNGKLAGNRVIFHNVTDYFWHIYSLTRILTNVFNCLFGILLKL